MEIRAVHFFRQWFEIKRYANEKGIAVIGDMPIYVAMDSVDVWADLPLFKIDKKTLKPKKVAGVPPDYFSEDGQLWGNPIYNWEAMRKDGYSWWISRIGTALKTFDVVRIDHFRAFASYYEVDANAENAKTGNGKSRRAWRFLTRYSKNTRTRPSLPRIWAPLARMLWNC